MSVSNTTSQNKKVRESICERLVTMLTARKNSFDPMFYKTSSPVDLDKNLYVYLSDDQRNIPSFCIPFDEFMKLFEVDLLQLDNMFENTAVNGDIDFDEYTSPFTYDNIRFIDQFTIQLLTRIPFSLMLDGIRYKLNFVCDKLDDTVYSADTYYIFDPQFNILTGYHDSSLSWVCPTEREDLEMYYNHEDDFIEFDENNFYNYTEACESNIKSLYEMVLKKFKNKMSLILMKYYYMYLVYIYDGMKYYHKNKNYCNQNVCIYESNDFCTIFNYVDWRYQFEYIELEYHPNYNDTQDAYIKFLTERSDSDFSEEESSEDEFVKEESSVESVSESSDESVSEKSE